MTVWCNRCERSFQTYNSYNQHARDSSRHWQCPAQCGRDCDGWDELLRHCRDEDCCRVCQGCDDGVGDWWLDDEEYWEHMDDCNVCATCERHFDSPDNLYQHKLTHRTLDYECLKCDRGFKTYGGMIIHLESGCCSEVDRDQLNTLAAECRRWGEFILEKYHAYLIDGDLEYHYGKVSPYFCPTCEAEMQKLSSLFQHVESQSCSQTLGDGVIGTLRRYLASYV